MTKVDITSQASNLLAGFKSAAATGLNGVQLPCTPADLAAAFKNGGKGVGVPADTVTWIQQAAKGLEPLARSVGQNPDAYLADASADELARDWLGIQPLLQQEVALLQCLHGLLLKASDGQDGPPPAGLQPLIDAVTAVPTPAWTLLIPRQLAPADGAVFSDFPRSLTLTWERIPLATDYQIQVEYCEDDACTVTQPLVDNTTPDTSATIEFVGKQPGRWRVAAVNASATHTGWSPWHQFTFTV